MDEGITQWINAWSGHSDVLDAAMLAACSFGAPIMVALVVALWWLGNPERDVRRGCIAGISSLLLGFALSHLWWLANGRVRPFDAGLTHLLVPMTPYRLYLSRHAVAATGIAFAFLLNRAVPVWTLILACMAALICFARIYSGLHYASDIFADLGVGLASALIVWTVCRPQGRIDDWLVNRF